MANNEETPAFRIEQRELLEQELLANLKAHADELAKILASVSDRAYEDVVYRFYHYSFKVYPQATHHTQNMVDCLRRMAPTGTRLAPLFEEICQGSIEQTEFELPNCDDWGKRMRPFIEAFFHARYFVEMAVKYADTLQEPPRLIPSGWAALLSLYGIR